MKLINIICLFFVNLLIGQVSCPIDDLLDEFILSSIKYNEYKKDVDIDLVLLDDRTEYLGFIGSNKKRLFVSFEFIDKSGDINTCYSVKGITRVYKGASRNFNGEIHLSNSYVYQKLLDNEVSYASEIESQGFSVLNYQFFENENLSSTGIFKGVILLNWYRDKKGKYHYDETLDYYPEYSNCSFTGTWESYKTGKKSKTSWAHYRILCSDDLDIGSSEFSANEKYFKYGWSNINEEKKVHPPIKNLSFLKKNWLGKYHFSLEDLERMGETHSVYYDFDISDINNPKIISQLDKESKKVKNCEVTHITKDTLVLMDKNKNDDIYVLSVDKSGGYNIAGSVIYLLNPPNDEYPLIKD